MTDRYKIVLKAFIPYPLAADPEQNILRAPAAAVEVASWGGFLTSYTSVYHGDDHLPYDGATVDDYRVRRWLEFDWDGDAISNISPKHVDIETENDKNVWHKNAAVKAAALPVYGQTTLYESITYETLSIGLGGLTTPTSRLRRETKFLANEETDCYATADYFRLKIHSGNPGVVAARTTLGVLEPDIDALIMGRFQPNGVLNVWGYTDCFPSYGLSIARFSGGAAGQRDVLFEEVIFDAYDPTKPATGFLTGSVRIFRGLAWRRKFDRDVAWK